MSPNSDDWSTRHSVLTTARRTAALINVLADDCPDPAEVADVLRAYGEADPIDLTTRDVAGMRAAAALLRQVFAAEHADGAAASLNRLLQEHTGPLRLTSHDGSTPWHPHLDHDDNAPWDEWLLASSCMALTVLVWDRQRPPGRICASPTCQNTFITQGSGPERRYCSRRCATRERVAAHRRSHSAEQSSEIKEGAQDPTQLRSTFDENRSTFAATDQQGPGRPATLGPASPRRGAAVAPPPATNLSARPG